ncbi:hypothetical protein CROQUDRAFT_90129 [Cronartium quercuum f. sp. fusiforme G11]|uniref:Uncharacterized protein n=1 Tax=Cronartium quercuum f. sp. fusiforme G11 TaxID=708437 RepID=A0A9P6NQT2_9BASI|nr:hypothetical protein CROQUDRAFT_90129 [Cronartium quercuum f. sp. fusiforme G11]
MDVSAHSNDEEDPERGIYVIKTLCYCSNATNVFFCCLDAEMEKANLASEKKSLVVELTHQPTSIHPECEQVMTKYGFGEQEENFNEEEDENDEGMEGVEGSINLEAMSPEDFEDDLYGVREWGNAYNSEDDEDWGGDDGNGKSSGSDGAEDEEGKDMYDDM